MTGIFPPCFSALALEKLPTDWANNDAVRDGCEKAKSRLFSIDRMFVSLSMISSQFVNIVIKKVR